MLNYAHGSDMKKYICKAIQMVGGIKDLAAILGVSERAVYAWKKGERYPSRSNLARLDQHFEQLGTEPPVITGAKLHQGVQEPVKAFGTPRPARVKLPFMGYGEAGYSETGLGEEGAVPLPAVHLPSHEHGDFFSPFPTGARDACWVLVPALFFGACSTGTFTEKGVSWHPFSLDWIPGQRCPVEGLRMMQMPGRGMGSTLSDKDFCLVNTSDVGLDDDGIYVLRHGESIFVKRVCRVPNGCLLRGDNREFAYQDFEIRQADFALGWEVLGRVIWTGKAL